MVEILVLSLIQGITEFLPVSSSSHLIIYSEIKEFSARGLILDVSLHIGSFLAVLIYFRKELLSFMENRRLFTIVIFASIPILVTGFVLAKTGIINDLRTLRIIGWTTIIFAIFLYISDKQETKLNIKENFTYKSGVLIGMMHILSLIPGVSRSGIAITSARFLGFNRVDATKISYYLSIPVLTAVSCFGLYENFFVSDNNLSKISYLGIMLSFLFSYITIKYFLIYIKKFNMNLFVLYRIFLGLIILFYAY